MPPNPPGAERYFATLRAARNVGLVLTRAQEEAFVRLLESYADVLASRVTEGLATRSQRWALDAAREIIGQMTRDMARSTRNGIRMTARRVAEMHAQATLALVEAAGAGIAVQMGGVGTATAQALLARPELSRAFVSIRRGSYDVVDGMIREAALRGTSGPELARQLRRHISGDVVGGVNRRAHLIARTEIANAEHEARVRASIESPVVAWQQWRISSAAHERDACDAIAEADQHGVGAGLYDPRDMPAKPHPRCRCFSTTVFRPQSEWGQERGPMPDRRFTAQQLGEQHELPPSQIRQLERAMGVSRQAQAA